MQTLKPYCEATKSAAKKNLLVVGFWFDFSFIAILRPGVNTIPTGPPIVLIGVSCFTNLE